MAINNKITNVDRQSLSSALINDHRSFTDYLETVPDDLFILSRNEKWTPAQHLDHMLRSVKPVVLAFTLPKFLLRLLFGKSNRPSRSYDEVVHKYIQKLAGGAKASGVFIPPPVPISQRKELMKKLNASASKLASLVETVSEKDLDTYLLPHPVLGKMTLREMIYFTIYHVNHHHRNLKAELDQH
jgi:DinB superfamily